MDLILAKTVFGMVILMDKKFLEKFFWTFICNLQCETEKIFLALDCTIQEYGEELKKHGEIYNAVWNIWSRLDDMILAKVLKRVKL